MEQFIREKIKDKPLNKKRLAKKQAQQHSAEWYLQWLQALFLLYFCRLSTDNQKSFRWKNNNDVQTATQQSGIDDSSDAYSEMVHKAQSPALLRSRLRRPISLHSQIIRQCRTSSTEWALRPRDL